MKLANIPAFQYLSSVDYVEAVTYAAKQSLQAREKWFVLLKDGNYIVSNEANIHPFTGVPCVAELHGKNIPVEEEANA